MKNKKNILIIPPFNPYPLVSGGHQAIFNGIAVLEDNFHVYLIVPITESQFKKGQHKAILQELPHVHIIPFILPESRHTIKWYWNVLYNKVNKYIQKLPFVQAKQKSNINEVSSKNEFKITDWIGDTYKEEIALVQNIIKKYDIDIVQCEMIPTLTLCDYIPSTIKKIFVHHELRYVRNELLLRQQPKISQDLIEQVQKDKDNEISYLNRYDRVITLSEVDSQKLKHVGVKTDICTSFAVVRNVPQQYFPVPSERRIVFIGPEFHAPNYEGVMWFLQNCWTKIQTIDPSYRFDIIGKWSQETAMMLSQKYSGVTCLGYVEDLYTAMHGATMIVPILVGSGIRMKILESAQWGVPIVSTTIGAEGLPLEHEKHIIIADTPDEFAKAVISFEDMKNRQTFIDAILLDILPNYTIDALRENRLKCYDL